MNILDHLYFMIRCNLKNFLTDEEGAVDIVAVVVLIGIAVLLAVVFRNQIQDLLNNLFESINNTAQQAVSN